MNLLSFLRALLWPFSVIYGALARLRAWLYARGWLKQNRLCGTVISIGNLTVGGTGKTPLVLWLAQRLLRDGQRVAILSRGYRGTVGSSDEVDLLRARLGGKVPLGMGADRYAQGTALKSQGFEVFLLDDGFQHLQLARDLDIVLVDGSRSLAADRLLPSGRLREPLAALRRAGLVVITRKAPAPEVEALVRTYSAAPIYYAAVRLAGLRRMTSDQTVLQPMQLGGEHAFAFCGIGNPRGFFQDLERWQIPLVGRAVFEDHHCYTAKDFRRLEDAARRSGAAWLVTTEKDAQNFGDLRFTTLPLYVCEIDLEISQEAQFLVAVENLTRRRSEARP